MPEIKQYPPMRLPKVTTENVALFNAVSLRAMQWQETVANCDVTVELKRPIQTLNAVCSVDFTIDESAWTLSLSSADFFMCHPLIAKSATTPSSIPDALKTALIEVLLEPFAQKLQSTLGKTVSINRILLHQPQPAHSTPVELGLAITITDQKTMGTESLLAKLAPKDSEDSTKLCTILASLPRNAKPFLAQSLQTIPVHLAVNAGQTRLQLDEFSALSLGDVVLVTDWMPKHGQANLDFFCGNRKIMTAPCSISDQTVALIETPNFVTENVMEDKKNIDVVLSFDLEERTIQMKDLETLAAGYTFTLASSAQTPVTIRANGKPIATGRLVDVNGKLGVEIVDSL